MMLRGTTERAPGVATFAFVELPSNQGCSDVLSSCHRRALGVFFQISWRRAVCNTFCSYTYRQNQPCRQEVLCSC